jgi:hypothetical protein
LTVCEWFGIKTTLAVFIGLASKLVMTVSGSLASKLAATIFFNLASKLMATISPGLTLKPTVGFLLSLKTKVMEDLPICASKPTALVW